MEEIQVGEYARTKYNGIIRIQEIKQEKVSNTYYGMGRSYSHSEDKTFIYYRNDDRRIPIDEILKHSFNLIDLIEVGDYVNGSRVVDIMEDMQTGELHLEMTYNYTNEEKGDCTIYNKDIKSIVTHEQFSSLEYKVEEK